MRYRYETAQVLRPAAPRSKLDGNVLPARVRRDPFDRIRTVGLRRQVVGDLQQANAERLGPVDEVDGGHRMCRPVGAGADRPAVCVGTDAETHFVFSVR